MKMICIRIYGQGDGSGKYGHDNLGDRTFCDDCSCAIVKPNIGVGICIEDGCPNVANHGLRCDRHYQQYREALRSRFGDDPERVMIDAGVPRW